MCKYLLTIILLTFLNFSYGNAEYISRKNVEKIDVFKTNICNITLGKTTLREVKKELGKTKTVTNYYAPEITLYYMNSQGTKYLIVFGRDNDISENFIVSTVYITNSVSVSSANIRVLPEKYFETSNGITVGQEESMIYKSFYNDYQKQDIPIEILNLTHISFRKETKDGLKYIYSFDVNTESRVIENISYHYGT